MLNNEVIVETQHVKREFISNLFLASRKERGQPVSDKFEKSERVFTISTISKWKDYVALEMFWRKDNRCASWTWRMHFFFDAFKFFVHKICLISLVRQAIRVPLPLFWSWTSPKNFQGNEYSWGSITSNKYSNFCICRRHAIDGQTSREAQMSRNTPIFFLQQLGFVFNLKKSALDLTQKMGFLRC